MKRLYLGLVLLAAAPAFADIRTDMLTDRVDRLDREMTLLQQQVYQAPARPAVSAGEAVPADQLADIYAHIESQGQALQELTRKMEEVSFAQAQLKEQLDLLKADTEVRFTEQGKVLETAVAVAKPAAKTPVPAKKPDMGKSAVQDKAAYDKAYDLLRKSKYAEAEAAFRQFMTDYPTSALVGNANYWLGETYYVRGQYETAAGIFADGFTKYQDNSKAPDNLLKLGLTMKTLGKKEEACTAWMSLAETFPKATDTIKKRAADEAAKLACPTA